MHVVEEINLTTFYTEYLDDLERNGFRLLILALIRDADAPTFYEDLRRYWSSLNDVTGPQALFVVAGVNASTEMDTTPTRGDSSWTGYSGDLASPKGSQTARLRQSALEIRQTLGAGHALFRANSKLEKETDLKDANSSQVSALAKHLGIREADVPCLHLSLISARGTETHALPLSAFADFSIYAVCKEIMEKLNPCFDNLNFAENWIKDVKLTELIARGRLADNELKDAIAAKNKLQTEFIQNRERLVKKTTRDRQIPTVIEHLAITADRSSSRDSRILQDVVELCKSEGITESEGLEWFRRLAQAEADHSLSKREAAEAKSAIAKCISRNQSTHGIAAPSSEVVQESLANERIVIARSAASETSAAINRQKQLLLKLQEEVYQKSRSVFNQLSANFGATTTQIHWNYFISYPHQKYEKDLAINLFQALSPIGKPFMDYFCLRPGQDWQTKLPDAQSNSDNTLAIISNATKSAHFQISEIQRAISLHRRGQHDILPIYTSHSVAVPFGLEQVQSMYAPDSDPNSVIDTVVVHFQRGSTERMQAPIAGSPQVANPRRFSRLWSILFGAKER